MLFGFLLTMLSTLIYTFALFLNIIFPFTIPTAFFLTVQQLVNQLGWVGYIIDVNQLLYCMFWFMVFQILFATFLVGWYIFRLVTGVFSRGNVND